MLDPLPYHERTAQRLAALEPASWAAVAAAPFGEQMHETLLRQAYRLDLAAHPVVGAALARASAALGVDAPVTVYQLEAGAAGANAMLLHAPDEVVIAISGNLLALLPEDELTAVLGHELAHHLLWTAADGRYLVADRLLDLLARDARTPAPYLETGRRWALSTELFADRGAARACGDLHTAVRALVTIATGLAGVDAAAYLAQAQEADPASGSREHSHPETVLRAWALDQWWRENGGPASAAIVAPTLDLDALDLHDREQLEELTRALIRSALAELAGLDGAAGAAGAGAAAGAGELVLAHARQFFPGLEPGERGAPAPDLPARRTAATESYLAYVLLDLATADPDVQEAATLALGSLAGRIGIREAFDEAVRREKLEEPRRGRKVTA